MWVEKITFIPNYAFSKTHKLVLKRVHFHIVNEKSEKSTININTEPLLLCEQGSPRKEKINNNLLICMTLIVILIQLVCFCLKGGQVENVLLASPPESSHHHISKKTLDLGGPVFLGPELSVIPSMEPHFAGRYQCGLQRCLKMA